MSTDRGRAEANMNQLLESFNADDTELAAFLENPKCYLKKLGAENLDNFSEADLRKMVQNHVER